MIPVTKPYLPNKESFQQFVEDIFKRQWLTNNGPLLQEYEAALKDQLGIPNLLVVSNGTIALQLAIKALKLEGEIVTTPFSYVATTSSIVWEGCQPVFADIDQNTLNIDPTKIEQCISERTTAILATHCFGNACDIDAIDKIANKYRLKVIYDAAHCFGTKYKGRSIFEYGDISTCSLHATKLIHSVEGGIVFSNDEQLLKRMAYMRNFGHDGPEQFNGVGINGKNSELHAAMGLCVLTEYRNITDRRRKQSNYYDQLLEGCSVKTPLIQSQCDHNYSYYPLLLESEEITIEVIEQLNDKEIYPRRYFYPSLSQLDYVSGETPISDDCSSRVICLPIFHDLNEEDQISIVNIIKSVINNG